MDSRVMQVFYGTDLLPYKDKERSVHYPIVGNSFLGASNTTEIRFYIEQIGSREDTWVANSKLPNGKMGNQLLTIEYDSEVEEYYAKLSLSTFYTQAKGDVYISLNGFYGGVEIVGLDSNGQETTVESNIVTYTIKGIPTIQATGVVKLSVYYATPLVGSDEYSQITLQGLLGAIAAKLDTISHFYIKTVSSITDINSSGNDKYFSAGDVVFADGTFYLISGTFPHLTASFLTLELDSVSIENLTIGALLTVPSFSDISNENEETLENYISSQISGASNTYVTLATEQTITGHKIFATTITANSNINFGNGSNINMYNGYILNNRTKLFGIGTSSNNRTFYQFPYGSITDNPHGENNPYTLTTQEYVQDYAYSKANTYTKSEIDTKLTSMLVYKGSKTVEELNALSPSLGETQTGWFYNVSNSGVLNAGNVEVFAGDNVAWTGSTWDKLTMDLSAYDDKFIAAGFFEVQNYNEENGTITFVYASDLYNMSYSESTGILTIEAN